jgi:hypothetical protein
MHDLSDEILCERWKAATPAGNELISPVIRLCVGINYPLALYRIGQKIAQRT